MRFAYTFAALALPCAAFAAGGGVGEGFGADDWLNRWPVLAAVLGAVVAMTTFITIRIVKRARAQKEAS